MLPMHYFLISLLLFYSSILNANQTELAETTASNSIASVPVLTIKGAIGPAVSHYLTSEIERANQQTATVSQGDNGTLDSNLAPLIIITIDTPGGLVSSLRDINQAILNSDIPIACLVHPPGARAASAGTYILYACHIAAMATTTTLGAATPVSIGPPLPGGGDKKPANPYQPTPDADNKPDTQPENSEGSGTKQDNAKQNSKDPTNSPQVAEKTAIEKKVLNDSVSYIRSLAQLRKRNVQWAELAVTEAATLTAVEALDKNVINLIAQSPQHLLTKLDGQYVMIKQQQRLLTLTNRPLELRKPNWRSNFIGTITDPNIAYILMLIGVYGILLEFYSPGIGIAGIAGSISLFIALYAFQLLPLDYVGLALLLLGIAFLIAESMSPSVGIFGLGGLIAFTLGSIFLFDTDLPQFQVSLQLIAALAVVSLLFFVFVFGYLWDIRKNKVVSGKEALIGALATADTGFIGQGHINIKGERWSAYCPQQLTAGQTVQINGIDGLTLILLPVTELEVNDASNPQ
ncbi:nodulation protein NfeD [Moritella marina]|uniref:NfeD family protein n=1 Tax=Moritella marina TaxID=90736 RepID=UPI003703ABB3